MCDMRSNWRKNTNTLLRFETMMVETHQYCEELTWAERSWDKNSSSGSDRARLLLLEPDRCSGASKKLESLNHETGQTKPDLRYIFLINTRTWQEITRQQRFCGRQSHNSKKLFPRCFKAKPNITKPRIYRNPPYSQHVSFKTPLNINCHRPIRWTVKSTMKKTLTLNVLRYNIQPLRIQF